MIDNLSAMIDIDVYDNRQSSANVDISVYVRRHFVYYRRHFKKQKASTFVDAKRDENAPGLTGPGGENRVEGGAKVYKVNTGLYSCRSSRLNSLSE